MDRIFAMHDEGVAIVGTSAGAAAVSETMLIGGASNASHLHTLAMAPGLALLKGVIVDSHFTEHGRYSLKTRRPLVPAQAEAVAPRADG